VDSRDDLTLRGLVDLLRRGFWVAVTAAALVGLLAYAASTLATPRYVAQSTIVTTSQDPNQRNFGTTLVTAPTLAVATYRGAIVSRTLLTSALLTLRGREPTASEILDLQRALTVRSEDAQASAFLRITVEDDDPVEARDLANAIAEAAVRWDVERATRTLETIIESLTAQIASIDEELAAVAQGDATGLHVTRADLALQLSSARALRAGAVGRIELFELAEVPPRPVGPRPLRNAAIAAVLALVLAYGLVVLQDALDTRVRSVDDLAAVAHLPILAVYPRVAGGLRRLPSDSTSYLRTAISFATTDVHPKVVLITSTEAGHGKSSVAIALAEAFARQHHKTLLIDADLRAPVLGSEFGLDALKTWTLRDALKSAEARESRRNLPTSVSLGSGVSLDVLPSFHFDTRKRPAQDPADLLSTSIRTVIDDLAAEYDVMVIDSPPVLPVADALTIAPHVSGVVFCVSLPDADRRSLASALTLLRQLGVRLFGIVATNVDMRGHSVAGFGYGYGPEPVGPHGAPPVGRRGPADAARLPIERSTT
jgi:capsular exopolysaccharide synthesis family protein